MRCAIHLSTSAGRSAQLFLEELRVMYAAWATKHARNVVVLEDRVTFDTTDADAEALVAREVGVHRVLWMFEGSRQSAYAEVKLESEDVPIRGLYRHARGAVHVRNYVLAPYLLCKDYLSGSETERVKDVLGGELGLIWGDQPTAGLPDLTAAKDGRVTVTAWVDPALREQAREAARSSGMEFSRWVERALLETIRNDQQDRKLRESLARGECVTCGYAPCLCDMA